MILISLEVESHEKDNSLHKDDSDSDILIFSNH